MITIYEILKTAINIENKDPKIALNDPKNYDVKWDQSLDLFGYKESAIIGLRRIKHNLLETWKGDSNFQFIEDDENYIKYVADGTGYLISIKKKN